MNVSDTKCIMRLYFKVPGSESVYFIFFLKLFWAYKDVVILSNDQHDIHVNSFI